MQLNKAAQKIDDSVEETLTYMSFPSEHWTRIRTNNTLERLNREIKRRTKVVGTFPDGESALMLVCARLRHVTSNEWGTKRYLVCCIIKVPKGGCKKQISFSDIETFLLLSETASQSRPATAQGINNI